MKEEDFIERLMYRCFTYMLIHYMLRSVYISGKMHDN